MPSIDKCSRNTIILQIPKANLNEISKLWVFIISHKFVCPSN